MTITLLSIATAILGVALVALWMRTRAQTEHQTTEHQAQLADVRTEARQRLDRLNREAQTTSKTAHLALATDFLPALDALDQALGAAADDDPFTEGLSMIRRDLLHALEQHEITLIEPEPGSPFLPEEHEGVSVAASVDVPAQAVLEVLRRGYRHPHRMLRAAMVVVSSGAPQPEAPTSREDEVGSQPGAAAQPDAQAEAEPEAAMQPEAQADAEPGAAERGEAEAEAQAPLGIAQDAE